MTQDYWNQKFMIKDHFGSGPTGWAVECAEFLKKYPKHKKFLDLGCGQGRDSIYFTGLGFDVTSMDYSERALLSLPSEIKKIQSDVRDIRKHMGSNSFDVIYSNEVLHFLKLEEAARLINEIYALLKQNGFFMFTCKNNKDKHLGRGEKIAPETFIFKDVVRHFFSEKLLKNSLKQFKIIRFDEGSHVMFGEAPSVYWKVIARKKD